MIQDEWRKRAKTFHLSYTDSAPTQKTQLMETTMELGLWEVCKRPMARR